MIITKKAIPRRTVLRGLGASLALPLLDAMVPAFAARTNAATTPVIRFGVVYVPNGIMMQHWMPDREGEGFELKPILKPFEPFRDRLLVLSGLHGVESEGPHARASTRFLTGVPSKRADGADLQAAVSMDQLIARVQGRTRSWLRSSSPSTAAISPARATMGSAAPIRTRSRGADRRRRCRWRTVRASCSNGCSATAAARMARCGARGSKETPACWTRWPNASPICSAGVGPSDRSKISQYLEAVRDIERRIQTAERQSARELPVIEQPRACRRPSASTSD